MIVNTSMKIRNACKKLTFRKLDRSEEEKLNWKLKNIKFNNVKEKYFQTLKTYKECFGLAYRVEKPLLRTYNFY